MDRFESKAVPRHRELNVNVYLRPRARTEPATIDLDLFSPLHLIPASFGT